MTKKYFPIHTETACQLKWAWSTLYLNTGVTGSCHRTSFSTVNEHDFFDFHNTPIKLKDRQSMIDGQWPESSCGYCKDIEEAGGVSDRMVMSTIPDLSPSELDFNTTAVNITPTVVEVYFNNICNLSCIYCSPKLSSSINTEYKQFGRFEKNGVVLDTHDGQYKNLVPLFWQWFEGNFSSLRRLHVLGGEAFYQEELDMLLEKIDLYPNPNCELNIVTNLMVSKEKLESYIDIFKHLLAKRKLKRIDITCSIDCWGEQQEYIRWGLKLDKWLDNFETLLKNRWLYVSTNQTMSALSMKTMPQLNRMITDWKKHHKVAQHFGIITDTIGPAYLNPTILGADVFLDDIDDILRTLPRNTDLEIQGYQYVSGIMELIKQSIIVPSKVLQLITFLEENDRRRGTNWRKTFPWLTEFEKYVVSSDS